MGGGASSRWQPGVLICLLNTVGCKCGGKHDCVLHSQSHKTCRWGGELEKQSDKYCSNHCPARYHGLIGTLWKNAEGINDGRMQTTQEPRQARSKYNSPPQGISAEYMTKHTTKALQPSEHSTIQASSSSVSFTSDVSTSDDWVHKDMAVPFEKNLISSCTAMHFIVTQRDRSNVPL